MKNAPIDAVATDYQNASKRGGKRRMADAVQAELERLEDEKKLQKQLQGEIRGLAQTPTFASCSCGWSAFSEDANKVRNAALTHALKHATCDYITTHLEPRLNKDGKANRTGELLIEQMLNPERVRPIPVGH